MSRIEVGVVNKNDIESFRKNLQDFVQERSRKIDIDGYEFDFVMKVYGEEKSQPSGLELSLECSSSRYFLFLDSKSIVNVPNYLVLNLTNILAIFQDVFFRDDVNSIGRSYKHSLRVEVLGGNKRLEHSESKSSEGNSQKRRKVSRDSHFIPYESKVVLDIELFGSENGSGKFVVPHHIQFEFISIPSLKKCDILPNEMFVEIFRYLEPFHLLREVNTVCKRFNCIIESEYMYKSVHFKYLLLESFGFTLNQKTPGVSWKEFVRKCWKNRAILLLDDDFAVSREIDGKRHIRLLCGTRPARILKETVFLKSSPLMKPTDDVDHCYEIIFKVKLVSSVSGSFIELYSGITYSEYKGVLRHFGGADASYGISMLKGHVCKNVRGLYMGPSDNVSDQNVYHLDSKGFLSIKMTFYKGNLSVHRGIGVVSSVMIEKGDFDKTFQFCIEVSQTSGNGLNVTEAKIESFKKILVK